MFDKEYSQVTMMREIEPNQVYYLEVDDEDLNQFLDNPNPENNTAKKLRRSSDRQSKPTPNPSSRRNSLTSHSSDLI